MPTQMTNRQIVTEFKRSLNALHLDRPTMDKIERACDELFPLIDRLQANGLAAARAARTTRARSARALCASNGTCLELRKSLARQLAVATRQAMSDLLAKPYAALCQAASADASDLDGYFAGLDGRLKSFAMLAQACFDRCDGIGLRESAMNMYLHSYVDEGGIPVQSARVGEGLFYRSSIQRISALRSAIGLFRRQFGEGYAVDPSDPAQWRMEAPLDAQELLFGYGHVAFRLRYHDSFAVEVELYPEYGMKAVLPEWPPEKERKQSWSSVE